MEKSHLLRRFAYTLVLLVMLGGMSSCENPDTLPRAWFDYPRDGLVVSQGDTVTVVSHAYARKGIAEVMLSVNGEAYRRDAPAEAGVSFGEIRQVWLPQTEGDYLLQVRTYDILGEVGNPDTITVRVVRAGEAAPVEAPPDVTVTEVSSTPTSTTTGTLVPPTDTPTPTVTSTNTRIPPTWTFTPTATETIVYIPPSDTPTQTEVPPDTTPPPVPSPEQPANGATIGCAATQLLTWTAVSDKSGISGYYVKLEKQITADSWQSAAGYGPLGSNSVNVNIECGLFYRWTVRAQDGKGNISEWSAFSQFSVILP